MTAATTVRFSGFRVLIGDGADPESFSAPCGFTEKGLSFSRELGEVTIPDCADEEAPAWVGRETTSQSATLSGQGVLTIEALPIWLGLLNSTESVNARVEVWVNNAKVGHWQGAFALESFENSAPKGERVNVNVTLQSDGAVLYTAA